MRVSSGVVPYASFCLAKAWTNLHAQNVYSLSFRTPTPMLTQNEGLTLSDYTDLDSREPKRQNTDEPSIAAKPSIRRSDSR